jgi:hypothetical protein
MRVSASSISARLSFSRLGSVLLEPARSAQGVETLARRSRPLPTGAASARAAGRDGLDLGQKHAVEALLDLR